MMRNMSSMVLALFVALVPVSAFAAPTPWVHPGQHPFEGTPNEAAVLHEKATGLPAAEYMKGVALFQAGQCEEFFMPDGMMLQNTFTKNGKARSVQTVVQFRDANGRPLSATDSKRRAARCHIPGRTDGATVVFPYVCKNWSLAYMPAPVVANVPPAPEPRVVYVQQPQRHTTVIETPGIFVSGTVITVGCPCCGQSVIGTPSVSIPGSVSVTTTFNF